MAATAAGLPVLDARVDDQLELGSRIGVHLIGRERSNSADSVGVVLALDGAET